MGGFGVQPQRRRRRDLRLWAGILLVLAGVAGMVWTVRAARRPGLDTSGFAGVLSFGVSVLGLLVGIASLAVALEGYWADRQEAADSVQLADKANDLARKVRQGWELEAKARQLYVDGSLTVSWQQAPAGLTEPWARICAVAEKWQTGGAPNPAEWAADSASLGGAGAERITEVFSKRVPTQRLVVLGREGAGKSVLLVQLLLGLHELRIKNSQQPVPVLLSLASWNPVEESDLFAWMDRRLSMDYEFLGQPAPAPDSSISLARALLNDKRILPLLDGFDEIKQGFRMEALRRINAALLAGQGIVLACRTEDYQSALSDEPADSQARPVPLAQAAGIELQDLDVQTVRDHLCEGGRDELLSRHWRPVTEQLSAADGAVTLALRTPLMASLAADIYSIRPGDAIAGGPSPGDLIVDPATDTPRTRGEIEDQLLAGFVPAAYRPGRVRTPWTPEEAERSLGFLAGHLRDNMGGTTDIEWWNLRRAVPRIVHAVVIGVPFWVAIAVGTILAIHNSGSAWLGGTLGVVTAGWVLGTLYALMEPKPEPAARIRVSWLSAAMVVGISCFVAYREDVGTGVLVLPVAVVIVFLGFGRKATQDADTVVAMDPLSLLERDRKTARTIILGPAVLGLIGIAGLLTFGLVRQGPAAFTGATAELPLTEVALTASGGIGLSLYGGLALAFRHTASPALTITCWYLALRRKTPRSLVSFLVDAHLQHGVLRRVGAVYQFRHLDVQRHLADHQ
ncbi:NACHT domain-containing protein [Streptomyces sp. uw30]|uniref:NACHT domain-containing protein n=1 Tax=Streptomyces sp. uw30 TaxID=1828179 RepID=UPI0011CDA368|nr:NACHT domain-containing protein [Streptomyces sp. uw30]TXS51950.1 NACHT domain-containing protein [Streptomyces sp. uw30]